MLKLMKLGFPLCLLLGAGSFSAAGEDYVQNSLEPCINGEVSASGAFRSDAAERQSLLAEAMRAQEPCINGDVPPDGVLIENRFDELAEQLLTAGRP